MHTDMFHTAAEAHFNELRRQAAAAQRVSELRRPRRARRINLTILRTQTRARKQVAAPHTAGC